MERKNAWKKYSDKDKNNVFTFADEYKTFISECKTERECVKKAVELAKKAGYRDLQEIIAANETLKALPLTFQHRAGVSPYTSPFGFA